MIIEDVPEMSNLISLYLSKEGMETFQSETGEDALDKLEGINPDLFSSISVIFLINYLTY